MYTNLKWTSSAHTSISCTDPDGYEITVPVFPGNRDYDAIVAQHGTIAEPSSTTNPITSEQVDSERDRRLDIGHSFSVPGITDPIPLQGTLRDQFLLSQLKDAAQDLTSQGVTDPVIRFHDGINVDHMVTPAQMILLVIQGRSWVSMMMEKGWALKALDPIPADYADDSHWS